MKTVCFLSMAPVADEWCIHDKMLVEPLKERGWTYVGPCSSAEKNCDKEAQRQQEVGFPWREAKSIDWSGIDVCIVRSTWDYQDDVETFQSALRYISSVVTNKKKTVILENPLETISWNCRKTYFRDIASSEKHDTTAAIIPSVFLHDDKEWRSLLADHANTTKKPMNNMSREHFNAIIMKSLEAFPELLFKPIVGASSFGAYRLSLEECWKPFRFEEDQVILALRNGKVTEFPPDTPARCQQSNRIDFVSKLDFMWAVIRQANFQYMVQPFVNGIFDGEVSLFFFGNTLSHAIHKVPRDGDFRIQEDFDATHRLVSLERLPLSCVDAARRALAHIPPHVPLYARIDLVPASLSEVFRPAVEQKWGICGLSESRFLQLQASNGEVAGELLTATKKKDGIVWSIMEVEVIEPSLYFDLAGSAGVANFCDEFCRRYS